MYIKNNIFNNNKYIYLLTITTFSDYYYIQYFDFNFPDKFQNKVIVI